MHQHCYFHKTQYIEHFCALKECTLPLCEQCLQIHQDEHRQKSQDPSIIPYSEAYEQVFGNLSLFIQKNKKPLQSLIDQVKKDKQQAILTIENFFKKIEQKIAQQSKNFSQIEQKFQKLKKGSIKTVIYYYSGDIALKQIKLPQVKEISSSLKKFLSNLGEERKQQIQTFRQIKIQTQWSQSKIQPYETRQTTQSKKKAIFQNDRKQSSNAKNTNEPYLQNNEKPQQQIRKKYTYEEYQRQKVLPSEDRSEVCNYFHQNCKIDSTYQGGESNKYKDAFKEEVNNYRVESNTFQQKDQQMYKAEFINMRNLQIESHLGLQKAQNNIRVLRQTPSVLNQQYKEIRSRTLDKFPSMIDLKKGRENASLSRIHNEEDYSKAQGNIEEFKPSKWNKNKTDEQDKGRFQKRPSTFDQSTVNEPSSIATPSNKQFTNRRPLKTTDLETYTPSSNALPVFEARDRASSFETGLRTTMSHNNLQATKKMEPLLGEDLKKQVLSPHEIRKMLEKKIEQRNKVLISKKEHQLKINTDRVSSNLTNGQKGMDRQTGGMANFGQKNLQEKNQTNQMPPRYDENTNMNWAPTQQRASLYNTKDSIINQIYRETRY